MKLWHVHPERRREVWKKDGQCIVVYLDLTDEWAMSWPEKLDRQIEPDITCLYRLMDDGWTRFEWPKEEEKHP